MVGVIIRHWEWICNTIRCYYTPLRNPNPNRDLNPDPNPNSNCDPNPIPNPDPNWDLDPNPNPDPTKLP